MRAMQLRAPKASLQLVDLPVPSPGDGQILIRVSVCAVCRTGLENLCLQAKFTGYHLDGGYAEYLVADERFCFPLPEDYADLQAAPLLCAGLIGYRALRLAGDAQRVGLYGF